MQNLHCGSGFSIETRMTFDNNVVFFSLDGVADDEMLDS